MTAIAKFLSREDGVVSKGIAVIRAQARIALRQHLEVCQIFADAMAQNHKR